MMYAVELDYTWPTTDQIDKVLYDDERGQFILWRSGTLREHPFPLEDINRVASNGAMPYEARRQAAYLMDWYKIAIEDGIIARPRGQDRRRELLLL